MLSVKDYITDWIDYRAAVGTVKVSTAEHYDHMLKPFLSDLGHMRMDQVKPADVKAFVYRDVKKYGAGTAKHRFVIVKSAFTAAVKTGDIPVSPFEAIEAPRAPKQDKLKALDPHQAKQLYHRSFIYGDAGQAIRLALTTGCRRGELCGFMWDDFDGQRLSVTRNVTIVANKVKVGTPKTHSSCRDVPLPDIMIRELASLQQMSAARGYVLGCQQVPLNPNTLTQQVNRVLEKEGLGQFTLHNLRHTYATHLLREGVPIKAVSERLGHSNTSVTMNVYAQALPQDNAAVVQALNSLVG